MLSEIGNRARMLLKALNGQSDDKGEKKEPEGGKAAVPQAPDDPDRMDPRVEDSSPKDGDLDEAKDDQADKGQDDQAGGDGADAGDTSGAGGDEDGDGDGEGFDEFGHKDMDAREIRKAFPEIGHLFPDEALDYIEEHEDKANKDAKGLELITDAIRGFGDVLAKITAELNELKQGQKATGRELKKALDSNAALEAQLKDLHKTVPAAAAPRAISKAMGTGAQEPQGFSAQELNTLAASGKMGSHEIAMLCLTRQRG